MIDELNGDFLQWLRGFYYVAKTGSVRKAAEQMRRNPSTISYQIQSLENSLGTILFDRHKKSLRITREGEILFQWAISTFETLQNLISSVGNAKGALRGGIRMAATLPIASTAVKVISKFIRQHPKVELTIMRMLSRDVRNAVAEAEVDFGLLPMIAKPDTDNLEVIAKSRPLLVLHRDNPWNVPPIPDLNDLRRLPYVAFSEADSPDDLGTYIGTLPEGNFIHKNAVLRVNNYHLIMRFVWEKLGVAIMDEMCYDGTNFGANWQNLEKFPLDHLFPNRLYGILTRRNRHISPQASALVDTLREYFVSISAYGTEYLWDDSRQNDFTLESAKQEIREKSAQGVCGNAGSVA